VLFYLLAAILGGCVPSLHSLFTDKDVFFEPQLVGTWSAEHSKEIWQFTKQADSNTYEFIYTDENGNKGSFAGTLGRINGMIFLDLFPDNSEIQANDFYKAHLVPAHTFLKIEQIQPTLKMRLMNPDKLGKMLASDPNLLKHEVIEDNRVVITASTQQLQQFMKQHANDEDLFGEPTDLKRFEPNEPNALDVNNVPVDANEMPV
jgi:DNA-directed RNA polymerase subunit H (RpoH/RPB5)